MILLVACFRPQSGLYGLSPGAPETDCPEEDLVLAASQVPLTFLDDLTFTLGQVGVEFTCAIDEDSDEHAFSCTIDDLVEEPGGDAVQTTARGFSGTWTDNVSWTGAWAVRWTCVGDDCEALDAWECALEQAVDAALEEAH